MKMYLLRTNYLNCICIVLYLYCICFFLLTCFITHTIRVRKKINNAQSFQSTKYLKKIKLSDDHHMQQIYHVVFYLVTMSSWLVKSKE